MLPYKWNKYFPYGNIIDCINVICFKVPCDNTNWNVIELISTFPMIKVIIDLRSSTTCYNPNYFKKLGIKYIKISIKGQTLPNDYDIEKFFSIIDESIKMNLLVGVHCTHGINRTGYMVCKYLIYKLSIPAKVAIHIFEENRGYKIERKIYLDKLLFESFNP